MTPVRSTGRSGLAVIAAVALVCSLLVGCSNSDSTSSNSLKIPVLWAGTDSSGKPIGGIEDAGVRVEQSGESGFGLDLTSVKAKAAGPQWLAASASAAAVATLLSAADPADLDIRYTITGSIDGPSGGAMLTVGTLAAIRNEQLAPGVTMTGTISPDGSVGQVSGIPSKLRGAADAGYKTVLLPIRNLQATGDSPITDMVEFGKTLGLDVRGVRDVGEAYAVFVGRPIAPPSTGTYTSSPAVETAARATTERLVTRLRDSINAAPATINQSLRDELVIESDKATAALQSGDIATAYGLANDSYTRLVRAVGFARANALFAAQGANAVRDDLLAQTAALRKIAAATIARDSKADSLDPVAQLTIPFAMGWVTYGDAVLAGIEKSFEPGNAVSPASYTTTAATIEEQRAGIEVFHPDAIEIVRATQNSNPSTRKATVSFLSSYTNFLVEAGDASLAYYETVVKRGAGTSESEQGLPNYAFLAGSVLKATNSAIDPDEQDLETEIAQSAEAITYFVVGSALVAGSQAFGLTGLGIGADPTRVADSILMTNSVAVAAASVNDYALALSGSGIDPGYPAWSAQWGTAVALATAGTTRTGAGSLIALNELWYDFINCAVLVAAKANVE
ncbi:Peptidase S16, Lon proteolytic domain containing protein [Acidimicrobiia bacterium]